MDPITIAMGLAQFAPMILKWITGSEKAEKAAEDVVEIARQVTGAQTPEEALAKITADRAAQLQFRMALMANETDLDKAYLADRQNARQRDVEYVKMGRTNVRANWMVALDVIGLLFGLFGMLILGYLKAKYPAEINDAVFGALMAQLGTITGYFGLCLRDAHNFEFGSSRGSREKDEWNLKK